VLAISNHFLNDICDFHKSREVAMPLQAPVFLSHAGVFVNDMDKMLDFYTRMFGFVVSDRGPIRATGGNIVFLTSSPTEHHQFVLATGRPEDIPFNVVNQISFRVDSLEAVRQVRAAVLEAGLTPRCVTHGNALSVYFHDPEGNRLEAFIDTPWYVPQPFSVEIDLSLPDEALWRGLEEKVLATPGFKSRAAWQEEIAMKLQRR
jgi:catechol 2,3-dioxygenase-like lactoylglutathione lyase family enzyme